MIQLNNVVGRNKRLLNILLFIILPVTSVGVEVFVKNIPADPGLIGTWFIFWAAGVRLLVNGIKRVRLTPVSSVMRELGFANIIISIVVLLSVFNSNWRPVAGCCIYFLHLIAMLGFRQKTA